MKLIWKKAYETGIKHIDDQHKKFVVMVNDLYNIVEQEEEIPKIDDLLNKLDHYADYHFKTEEKLFDKYSYSFDDLEIHLEKHSEFHKKLEKMRKDSSMAPLIVAYRLADYLRKWIVDHIMKYDMKYAGFIREKEKC